MDQWKQSALSFERLQFILGMNVTWDKNAEINYEKILDFFSEVVYTCNDGHIMSRYGALSRDF